MKFSNLGRLAVGLILALFGACFLPGSYARPKPPGTGLPFTEDRFLAERHRAAANITITYQSIRPSVAFTFSRDGGRGSERRRLFGGGKYRRIVTLPRDRCGKRPREGFITDGDSREGATVQEVVVFDLKTLKVTGRVKTAQVDTDAIIYEPVTKHIFTFNGDSHNATVIDAVKECVITNLDLIGKVEFPAVDGKGMVYDNNPEKNDIVAIDAKTNTIKSRWPTAPAGKPTSMAIDRKNRRLFSAGRGPQFVIMMDADTGKVLQSYPISAGVDANAFDPGTGMLFVATREGMLHIYHEDSPDKLSEVEAVKTEYGAKTLQVDPKTHKVF